MDIYEGLVIGTFIMCTIILISQYIDANIPKVSNVLQLMNILPCYKVKAYRDGKLLKTIELVDHINSSVKDFMIKDGILYIEIY